jgi:hypothetical protein
MDEPFRQEVKDAVNAAGLAATLDDRAAVALAASFYKNRDTGQTDGQFGQGWEVLEQVSPPGGYDGIALRHGASRSLVIVNRGTEGTSSVADWLQNIRAGMLHQPGPQMTSAMALLGSGFEKAKAKGVDQILICGHSLGGALADAQGALAKSFFDKRGTTSPPVRVVGVASAGFAPAGRNYAAANGLTPDPAAPAYITHYVRSEDLVPSYTGRAIFGTDQKIASVYEARFQPASGPHATGHPEWVRIVDRLKQHMRTLYYQFFAETKARHIWYSHNAQQFAARNGAFPDWKRGFQRPDDW